jgi:hypothetical protein
MQPQGACFAILMMIGSFERTDTRIVDSEEEIQSQLVTTHRINAVSLFSFSEYDDIDAQTIKGI